MSNLSSSTLFHFTSSLDVIEKILDGGIKYGMFAEKFPKGKMAYFIRGISFCNIPLSMISEHVDWYGKYAIGIKRRKLREMGVSPVFYIHSGTKLFPSSKNVSTLINNPFLCYLKQYLGYQFHKTEQKYLKKSFIDEKEWRIFAGTPSIEKYDSMEALEERRKLKDDNTPTEEPLKVSLDMIEYIILESAADFGDFDDYLKSRFPEDRERFLPKVLFYSQIKKDF